MRVEGHPGAGKPHGAWWSATVVLILLVSGCASLVSPRPESFDAARTKGELLSAWVKVKNYTFYQESSIAADGLARAEPSLRVQRVHWGGIDTALGDLGTRERVETGGRVTTTGEVARNGFLYSWDEAASKWQSQSVSPAAQREFVAGRDLLEPAASLLAISDLASNATWNHDGRQLRAITLTPDVTKAKVRLGEFLVFPDDLVDRQRVLAGLQGFDASYIVDARTLDPIATSMTANFHVPANATDAGFAMILRTNTTYSAVGQTVPDIPQSILQGESGAGGLVLPRVETEAQNVLIAADAFPVPGFVMALEEARGANGWHRYFAGPPTSPYLFVDIDATVVDEIPSDPFRGGCERWSSENITRQQRVDAAMMGDHVLACKMTFNDAAPLFVYEVTLRNVQFALQTRARNTTIPNETDIMAFLAALATHEAVLVDEAAPGRYVGGEVFDFDVPAIITVKAGEDAPFSFCAPRPATPTSACGPMPQTANPRGGEAPYHFVLGPGTGFPPFGLSLGKDGLLQGKADPRGAGSERQVNVCAIDLRANAVCRDVVIVVQPPLPERPDDGGEPATGTSFVITSATCSYVSSHGDIDTTYRVLVKGTASGPVNGRLVLPSLPGYLTESWESQWGERNRDVVDRAAGDPERTSWTADLTIGGGRSKTVTVEGYVRVDQAKTLDSRTLMCARP